MKKKEGGTPVLKKWERIVVVVHFDFFDLSWIFSIFHPEGVSSFFFTTFSFCLPEVYKNSSKDLFIFSTFPLFSPSLLLIYAHEEEGRLFAFSPLNNCKSIVNEIHFKAQRLVGLDPPGGASNGRWARHSRPSLTVALCRIDPSAWPRRDDDKKRVGEFSALLLPPSRSSSFSHVRAE